MEKKENTNTITIIKTLIMKTFKSPIFGVTIILLINACTCNSVKINMPEDISSAQNVAELFYENTKAHDYKNSHRLFGEKYFQNNDSIKLDSFLIKINNKYGDLKEYKLYDFQTRIRTGSHPVNEYKLWYKCIYEKDSIEEKFELEKEKYDIKIIKYSLILDDLK